VDAGPGTLTTEMVPSPVRGTLFGAAGSTAPLDDPSASSAGSTDGDGVGVVAGLGDAAPDRLATDGDVAACDGVGVDDDVAAGAGDGVDDDVAVGGDGEPDGEAEADGEADAVAEDASDGEAVTRPVEDAAGREDGSRAGRFMAISTAPTTANTATTQRVAPNRPELGSLSRSGTALPLKMAGPRRPAEPSRGSYGAGCPVLVQLTVAVSPCVCGLAVG
jgi:hypothetical protein